MVKTTSYFKFRSKKPDRTSIKEEWILDTIKNPLCVQTQKDGRIRFWSKVGTKYLRVVTLSDGTTVHNAFFDRGFKQ